MRPLPGAQLGIVIIDRNQERVTSSSVRRDGVDGRARPIEGASSPG